MRMILLKPRGRRCRVLLGFHEGVDLFTEDGIGQHTLKLVPRDRLQDNPRIMREFP